MPDQKNNVPDRAARTGDSEMLLAPDPYIHQSDPAMAGAVERLEHRTDENADLTPSPLHAATEPPVFGWNGYLFSTPGKETDAR